MKLSYLGTNRRAPKKDSGGNPEMHNSQQHDADFLLNGDSGKSTGLYPEDFVPDDCLLVTSIGECDLRRVKSDD